MKQQNKLTAIYCRLSRDDEGMAVQPDAAYQGVRQDSMSIQNQKTYLSQYAKNNRFFDYVFYVDDGFSGTMSGLSLSMTGLLPTTAITDLHRSRVLLTSDML